MTTRVFPCKLERVVDGDTVWVVADLGFLVSSRVEVRIAGINAPELSTTEGGIARAAAIDWFAMTGALTLICTGRDKYGRWVGDFVRDPGGVTFAKWMLDGGYATVYP